MRRCLQKLGSLAGTRCGCHPAVLTQKEEVSPGSPLFLEQALSGRSLRGRPSSFHEPSYREKKTAIPVSGSQRMRAHRSLATPAAGIPYPFQERPALAASNPLGRHRYLHRRPKAKSHEKGLWHPPQAFQRSQAMRFPAIVRTPFPGRLPGSRPYRRLAAPAGTRPARLPGTGPSAGCSCCPGPPAGGCRRH